MPYTIELAPDAVFVDLRLSGDVPRAEHERSTEEASTAVRTNGCKGVLVDIRELDSRMSAGDDYEFVSSLQSRYPPATRFAVIVAGEAVDHFRFVEDVARNSGANLTLFSNRPAAVDWLTH